MNLPFPVWMWIIGAALVLIGLVGRGKRFDPLKLPSWVCVVLVIAAMFGMWVLVGAQFGTHALHL